MKNVINVVGIILLMLTKGYAQEWKVKLGDKSPEFVVVDNSKKTLSSKQLVGKVVFINFFATWCPPCRKELPRLQGEIYDVLKNNKEFEVLVLGREEGWDKLDPFMKQHGYTFPVYPDLNRAVYGLFATQTIPRNVVLNREGKIIYQSIGFDDNEFSGMVKLIKHELGKK